jgi:hypothetical protein
VLPGGQPSTHAFALLFLLLPNKPGIVVVGWCDLPCRHHQFTTPPAHRSQKPRTVLGPSCDTHYVLFAWTLWLMDAASHLIWSYLGGGVCIRLKFGMCHMGFSDTNKKINYRIHQ